MTTFSSYNLRMKNLRKLRLKKGLTQVQLAAIMECSQPRIPEWELFVKTPRRKTAERLARALGCKVEELG